MRAPAWVRRISRPRRTGPGTVEVTITADVSGFVDAVAEVASVDRYQRRVEHERSLGRAYVGTKLDDLCRDVGLDPVAAWRMPRLRDALVVDLNHPDRATRQAAEAAWLRAARVYQAQQAAARRAVVADG